MANDFVEVRIHLNGGQTIEMSVESDEEPEEVLQALAEAIDSAKKPHWHVIDSSLVFTGAVSAIEIL